MGTEKWETKVPSTTGRKKEQEVGDNKAVEERWERNEWTWWRTKQQRGEIPLKHLEKKEGWTMKSPGQARRRCAPWDISQPCQALGTGPPIRLLPSTRPPFFPLYIFPLISPYITKYLFDGIFISLFPSRQPFCMPWFTSRKRGIYS